MSCKNTPKIAEQNSKSNLVEYNINGNKQVLKILAGLDDEMWVDYQNLLVRASVESHKSIINIAVLNRCEGSA